MQNKNPILVLTGAAIVAAAAVAGITRDKWMGPETPAVTAEQTTAATEQPAPVEAPAANTEAPAAAPEVPATTPASEQPATAAAEDSAAPAAPAAPAEQPSQPQPDSNAADVPEVPTFDTVNIQKTGEAVIAGRAEAGAEVVVRLDGTEIGRTTANADGAFVVVPDKPLPSGSGELTIEALGQGESTPLVSEQSVAVIVPAGQPAEALVAVVSPNEPTRILQKPEPAAAPADAAAKPATLVSIDAVDYDTAGNIVFSGKGDPGNTARIYVDNVMIGDAAVGDDGRWTFSGTADIAPGNHTLRVDGLDAEGKVVNRVEVPFFREEQNKVAEAAPAETTIAQTDPAPEPAPAAPAEEQPASPPAAEAPAEVPEAAPATADTAAPAPPKQGRVVIQPGNNLWHISRVLYGSGAKYTMLYEANKDQIRDPDRIYPGQVFKTPEVAPKAETIDPKRRDPLKPEESEPGSP
jgi:nucleoid-associated protein YgaU